MIKAVIFDMDGIIVDGEIIQSRSLEKLLIEYGKIPIFNDVGLLHIPGPSGDECYRNFIRQYSIEEDITIVRKRNRKFFEELLKEKLIPLPGLLELIKTLKRDKIKIAVASNRFINHVYMILDNLNIKESFEIIVGPSPDVKHKPAPDIYLKTVKELNIKPTQCVAIEDTETGILSAKAAGMKVIAVPNKYTKHHDFSKADKIVNSLSYITILMLNNL